MCPNLFLFPVSEGHPQAVLTLQPAWAQIFTGEAVTLSYGRVILQTPPQPVFEGDSLTLKCHVRTGYTATRIQFFKENKELQYRADTERSVDCVSKSDEGSYKCRSWRSASYLDESAEVQVSVRGRYIHTGVYSSCVNVTLQRYIHTGVYSSCVNVLNTTQSYYAIGILLRYQLSSLFSRVTLTASPGVTVKEGEALNLTCEAAVNKTPRSQLHYTIVRDGEPVTNSTDSALYSIASTEKSHTGSYTCAVESQGVKKSSQELHIEVQTSWQSAAAAAAAGFSVGFFVILLIVFTLLLLYHKIRGVPCITGGKRSDTWRGGECGIIAEVKLIKPGVSHHCHRERSDQIQDQAAGGVELSSQAQQPEGVRIGKGEARLKKGESRVVKT
ncbi:UNVERIFIED_CONTAM: hypothetical protein FKN15_013680 [Acipenser sinensis]